MKEPSSFTPSRRSNTDGYQFLPCPFCDGIDLHYASYLGLVICNTCDGRAPNARWQSRTVPSEKVTQGVYATNDKRQFEAVDLSAPSATDAPVGSIEELGERLLEWRARAMKAESALRSAIGPSQLAELREIHASLLKLWEAERGGAFTPLSAAVTRIGRMIALSDGKGDK